MALGLPSVLVGSWTDEVAATGVTVMPPPGALTAAVEAVLGFAGRGDGDAEEAALSNTTVGCMQNARRSHGCSAPPQHSVRATQQPNRPLR